MVNAIVMMLAMVILAIALSGFGLMAKRKKEEALQAQEPVATSAYALRLEDSIVAINSRLSRHWRVLSFAIVILVAIMLYKLLLG